MEKSTIAFILLLLGSLSVLYHHSHPQQQNFENFFIQWKNTHNIQYSETQDSFRIVVFAQNYRKIQEHNSNPDRTYDMGINQMSGLTHEEFVSFYLGTKVPTSEIFRQLQQNQNINADIDWRTKGAVTPVKNQGQCGSCWAFSSTGGLQGAYYIKHKQLLRFSQQQLVDCSKNGNNGCQGGWMDNAFEWVIENGITTQTKYPYVARDQACKIAKGEYKFTKYTDVQGCTKLQSALVSRPISVAVDAQNWQNYKSGVFNNCSTSLDHGVLLVGMNSVGWIVKNSWAVSWGDRGYIHLSKGNTCGICDAPSFPTA